jgi:hypothetical protein
MAPAKVSLVGGTSALVLCLGLGFGACSSDQQRGVGTGAGGAGSGGTGAGGQGNHAGSGLGPIDAGAITPILDGGLEGATCAEESYRGEPVPLDLMLLVDGSSSMLSMVNGRTKWAQVADAMNEFVSDPRSAGLGVGLQFVPLPGTGSVCQTDRDCGFLNPPTPPPCQPTQFCTSGTPMSGLRSCGPRSPACPQGSPCVPGGRCAVSLLDCTNVGQACSPAPGDTCAALPKTCDQADTESCDPGLYQVPAVPFAAAPMPAARLVSLALAARAAGGATPLGPAVKGSLAYLDAYLAAHAGHRGAFVIATDGEPAGCSPVDIPSIAAMLSAARTGTRAVTTYVIGIFSAGEDASPGSLDQLATAGGTAPPFLIRPMDDLAQRFLEALDTIRGRALPCTFTIPKTSDGGAIDPRKVNVHFQGSSGNELVYFVKTADRCDPVQGGWYYDVDPDVAVPTRIIVCDATCAHWKAESNGKVELRYGCATQIVR